MSEYGISEVRPYEKRSLRQIDALLDREGIRRDPNLDYTCAMYDENMNVIATGSCFGNTLRCMAVSGAHQGEGLMNEIVTHLMEEQYRRGNTHMFLYTKCSSAKFFAGLGFYEIVRVEDQIVFMENRRSGFADWLDRLEKADGEKISAVVMNANPFTKGHRYLLETACRQSDIVHLFVVSEDLSLFPFAVRKRLIEEGTADLKNIILHESGPYIISAATFPSYFQKDEAAVIRSHAYLDLSVFVQIAKKLGITRRFVGEEPRSLVTGIYNETMRTLLPENGIACTVVPRLEAAGRPVSASDVRAAIKEGKTEELKDLLPETTLRFLASPEAEPLIRRIRNETDVIHY